MYPLNNASIRRRVRDQFQFHYFQGNYDRALELANHRMENDPFTKFHRCLALVKVRRKEETQELIMSVYHSDALFDSWMEPRSLTFYMP